MRRRGGHVSIAIVTEVSSQDVADVDRSAPRIVTLLVFVAILAHNFRRRCQADSAVIAATVLHAVGKPSGASRVSTRMADPPTCDSSPPEPSLSDIRHALAVQYTDEVKKRVERYARRRAWFARRAGVPIPSLDDYAEELAHDAMTTVWLGVRRWNPSGPIGPRLCWIIRDRTWREIVQAQEHEHVSFDLAANDAAIEDAEETVEDRAWQARDFAAEVGIDVDQSLAGGSHCDRDEILFATLARQVVDAVVELARRNEAVRAILGCWEQGFFEREEILLITGLSAHAYDAARQKIRRLAKRLPPELREAVHDLLRRVS